MNLSLILVSGGTVLLETEGTDMKEMFVWGLACALFCVFVLGIATLQYYR